MKLLLSSTTQRQLDALVDEPGGSYIFSGPESVGKYSAACEVANKIVAHPSDITAIVPDGLSMGIEQIHKLVHQLQLKSAGSKNPRVIILDDAQTLTNEAQNALLKLLEEPPLDSTIILIANQRQRLLPTIRSRCRNITFVAQETQEIKEWLASQCNLDEARAHEVASLCSGAVGGAIELAQNPQKLMEHRQLETWAISLQTGDVYDNVLLAKELGSDRQRLQAVTSRLLVLVREQLRKSSRDYQQLKTAYRSLQSVLYTQRYLEANGSPKFALDNLALGLAR